MILKELILLIFQRLRVEEVVLIGTQVIIITIIASLEIYTWIKRKIVWRIISFVIQILILAYLAVIT